MEHPRCKPSRRGFSLVELMVVVVIILTIAAVAIPTVMTSVANVRLRSSVSTISGLLQSGRILSVKDNRRYSIHFATLGSSAVAYVDLNGNDSLDGGEPQVQVGGTIVQATTLTGVTPLNTAVLGYTPQTGDMAFNARGLPCTPSGSSCGVGFAFYFTDNRKVGTPGWAAVSITPAGRVKTWIWAGGNWSD